METLKAGEKRGKKINQMSFLKSERGGKKRSICTALSSKAALIRWRRSSERNPLTDTHTHVRGGLHVVDARAAMNMHASAERRTSESSREAHVQPAAPLRDGAGKKKKKRRWLLLGQAEGDGGRVSEREAAEARKDTTRAAWRPVSRRQGDITEKAARTWEASGG